MNDASRRFSDRVSDYVRYRPGYPDSLVRALRKKSGIDGGAIVADIGAGTGIFSKLLLEAGCQVIAVEPNSEMRSAAEQLLSDQPAFTSIAAPAENTGLDDHSVDMITAAQAFHWFNNEPTRAEFGRILKPNGYLALIWNRRRVDEAFQRDYETLLRRCAPEYNAVNHMNLDDSEIGGFFAPGSMEKSSFQYSQRFDFDGLLGRVRSSSYCPAENSEDFRRLHDDLQVLFNNYQVKGSIDFAYDTDLYLGAINR